MIEENPLAVTYVSLPGKGQMKEHLFHNEMNFSGFVRLF